MSTIEVEVEKESYQGLNSILPRVSNAGLITEVMRRLMSKGESSDD